MIIIKIIIAKCSQFVKLYVSLCPIWMEIIAFCTTRLNHS